MKRKTTKAPTGSRHTRDTVRELAPEYRFDYSKSKKNRFARRVQKDVTVVVLDPDVVQAFPTAEAVNRALRHLVSVADARARKTKKARKQPA